MSTKGYVFLTFFVYAGLTLLFNISIFLLGLLGVKLGLEILIAIKVIILFSATFIAASRFIFIEARVPHNSERDSISMWTFLTLVLGMILAFPIGLGRAQSQPDVSQADALASQSTVLAVLSLCAFLFLHLNFGAFARMRKTSGS
jgi:hypothetical protein